MPTIHRAGGFSFRIYLNDHPPAHVHAVTGDIEIAIVLSSPLTIRETQGSPKKSEITKAVRITEANREIFLNHWRKIHEG